MTDFLDYHFFLAEADALNRDLGFDAVFQMNIETLERLGHAGWKKLWLA
jgi:hypothetical protein